MKNASINKKRIVPEYVLEDAVQALGKMIELIERYGPVHHTEEENDIEDAEDAKSNLKHYLKYGDSVNQHKKEDGPFKWSPV